MKLAVLTMTLTATAVVASAQEAREVGAHEHGHGALNIAVDGNRIAMQLEAPGFDIVGFEHAAESTEDRAAIQEAVALLAQPGELFRFPDGAGCSVTEASVELLGGEHHEGDAHAEEEHEAHAEGEDRGGEARHTEFHAAYGISCDDPDALTAIDFPYFEVFPNAEELELQMVTDAGAGAATVERDAPSLDLAGMM